jgi:hypothetical protein
MYELGAKTIYLTGPNGLPYAVEVGDAIPGTTATTPTTGTPAKDNVLTKILAIVPGVLGALFPTGVGGGGTTATTPYTPAPTTQAGNSLLSNPVVLAAGAVGVLLLTQQPKGRKR